MTSHQSGDARRRVSRQPPAVLRACARLLARTTGLAGVPDDFRDIYDERLRRRGALSANLWYLGQLVRGVWFVMRQGAGDTERRSPSLGTLAGSVGTEWVSAARRLLSANRALTIQFAVLVGLGVAASVFMVQTRESMRYPDLGIEKDVFRVSWQAPDGRRSTLPPETDLTTAALLGQRDGLESLLPIATRTAPLQAPTRWINATLQLVPAHTLTALGVRPPLGRDLREYGEVVLSHTFWRAHWPDGGGLGDELFLDDAGVAHRVVGVAPPDFDGPICCIRPAGWTVSRGARPTRATSLYAVGVADPPAAAGVIRGWLASSGASVEDVRLSDVRDRAADLGSTLGILMGLAVLAFAGTVLNGANLLVSDIVGRRRELGLRQALGASRRRIAFGILSEVGWLALAAAFVGAVGAAFLMRVAPQWIPMLNTPDLATEVRFGWPAVAATAATAGVVAALAGIPAVVASVGHSRGGLVDRTAGATRGRTRVPTALLVGQIALAVVLAAASALHHRALARLDLDFVGFRDARTAVFFASSVSSLPSGSSAQLLQRMTDDAGVRAAALSRTLPVYGAQQTEVEFGGERLSLALEQATAAYFETLGLSLLAGAVPRDETEAVLSEDAARRLGVVPAAAIGATVDLRETRVRIVGIAESASWGSGDWRPSIYQGWAPEAVPPYSVLLVRPAPGAASPGIQIVGDIAQTVGLAVSPFGTLDSLLVRSRVMAEFLARSASGFSALCLLVALGGLTTHFLRWVRWRRRDLGIRLCLGATAAQARAEVFRAARVPLAGGVLAGVTLATLAAGTMVSLMPELPDGRMGSIVTAAILVTVLSLATLVLPATVAGRADPLEVLRRD